MFLETLDYRANDVLIYSQNKFNFNDNFKIIYKNEKVKRIRNISYFEVCSIVKNPAPKNLIVYRLLTNVNHLDAYSTKYGYFIQINGKVELIYFDPIFALKDLRHLRFDLDPDKFRFKIQQVGLTSLTRKIDPTGKPLEADFSEVYSFDLKAIEAQHQNDKIFADAIFAFEDIIDESEYQNKQVSISNPTIKKDFSERVPNISEDRNVPSQNLNRVNSPNPERIIDLREEIVDLLKQALGIQQNELSNQEKLNQSSFQKDAQQFLETGKKIGLSEDELKEGLFELFKSTGKTSELSNRQRESVILRFDSD
ncbi:MAG: hypothetical protein N2321_04670 [Melioribacteraceae bacterium]|nr:hypothetical protein [Melioribacteraceae bacterium]